MFVHKEIFCNPRPSTLSLAGMSINSKMLLSWIYHAIIIIALSHLTVITSLKVEFGWLLSGLPPQSNHPSSGRWPAHAEEQYVDEKNP